MGGAKLETVHTLPHSYCGPVLSMPTFKMSGRDAALRQHKLHAGAHGTNAVKDRCENIPECPTGEKGPGIVPRDVLVDESVCLSEGLSH